VAVVLLGLACATAKTPPPGPAGAPRQQARYSSRYPSSEYVTGTGTSAVSQDDAEQKARIDIAAQIRSNIKGGVYSVEGVDTLNGRSNDFQRVVSEVKTRTEFKHNEMIKIDRQSVQQSGGQWSVLAFLSRADFYETAMREYDTAAAGFRSVAPTLPALQNEAAAFTPAYRRAQAAFQDLVARDVEIHAISGRHHPGFAEDSKAFMAIDGAREKLLRGLRITVNPERTEPPEAREVMVMALTRALTRLGLEATPGVCGPQRYELLVNPRIECHRAQFGLGRACVLSMTGSFNDCSDRRQLAAIDLKLEAVEGDDNRATVQLYRAISDSNCSNPDCLLPQLVKALSPVLPIDVVEDRQASEREGGK